jgi:hypothetical protein
VDLFRINHLHGIPLDQHHLDEPSEYLQTLPDRKWHLFKLLLRMRQETYAACENIEEESEG